MIKVRGIVNLALNEKYDFILAENVIRQNTKWFDMDFCLCFPTEIPPYSRTKIAARTDY